MLRVFISYTERDAELAGKIAVAFIQAGCQPLIDHPDRLNIPPEHRKSCKTITPANPFSGEIGQLLGQADRFVLCLSDAYLHRVDARGQLRREAKKAFAHSGNKQCFPIEISQLTKRSRTRMHWTPLKYIRRLLRSELAADICELQRLLNAPLDTCPDPDGAVRRFVDWVIRGSAPTSRVDLDIGHYADRTGAIRALKSAAEKARDNLGELSVVVCPAPKEECPAQFATIVAPAWLPLWAERRTPDPDFTADEETFFARLADQEETPSSVWKQSVRFEWRNRRDVHGRENRFWSDIVEELKRPLPPNHVGRLFYLDISSDCWRRPFLSIQPSAVDSLARLFRRPPARLKQLTYPVLMIITVESAETLKLSAQGPFADFKFAPVLSPLDQASIRPWLGFLRAKGFFDTMIHQVHDLLSGQRLSMTDFVAKALPILYPQLKTPVS